MGKESNECPGCNCCKYLCWSGRSSSIHHQLELYPTTGTGISHKARGQQGYKVGVFSLLCVHCAGSDYGYSPLLGGAVGEMDADANCWTSDYHDGSVVLHIKHPYTID
jgi:hypothetical protein